MRIRDWSSDVCSAELADPSAKDRDDGVDRYRAAMATWLPIFLQDQIKINDSGGSDYLINRLAENGWTVDLWFARGELYRNRGNQSDMVNRLDEHRYELQSPMRTSLAATR